MSGHIQRAMNWSNTLAVVTEVERATAGGQWRIGDAIAADLKEAGFSTVEKKPLMEQFADCAKRLESQGYDYSAGHCRKLYLTAKIFGHNERNSDFSWNVHFEAGAPENLRRAAAALRELKKPVSTLNVRWIMQEWRDKAGKERKEKFAAAKTAKAEAKEKAKRAAEKKLAAKNRAEREAAEIERQEAKREEAEANQAINKTFSPIGNANIDPSLLPKTTVLEAFAVLLCIDADARKLEKKLRDILKELDPVLDCVGPEKAQQIITGFTRVSDVAQEIIGRVRGHTRNKFKVHHGSGDIPEMEGAI